MSLRHFTRSIVAAGVALCFALPANALGLHEAYQAALKNDPTWLAAVAENNAGQQNDALALAGLLPQISGSIYKGKTMGRREQPLSNGRIYQDTLDYVSESYSVQLRQSLFNWQRISEFRQGRARVRYSDALFTAKKHELGVRVATAYFDALLAQRNLELSDARVKSLSELAEQAEMLYKAGEGIVTDIDEARARRDIAIAERYEAQDRVQITLRSLRELTGAVPDHLRALGDKLPLALPLPATVDDWLDMARRNSPQVLMSEQALEVASREVDKNRAGHMPTVELVGSVSKADSESLNTLNQRTWSRSLGVQVTIPIFSGGYTTAAIAQSVARREQATQELEIARNKTDQDVTRYFTGTVSGVSKVKGYEQAVVSSERALHSTRMGFKAGMRTSVDILNAEEQLYRSQRDLAQSRYQYLVNTLQLKASAGILTEADILDVDRLLAPVTDPKKPTEKSAAK